MRYAELTASQFVKTDKFNSTANKIIHLPERGMQIFVVPDEGTVRQSGSTQVQRITWHRVDKEYFEIEYFSSEREKSVHNIGDELSIDVYQLKRVHLGVF